CRLRNRGLTREDRSRKLDECIAEIDSDAHPARGWIFQHCPDVAGEVTGSAVSGFEVISPEVDDARPDLHEGSKKVSLQTHPDTGEQLRLPKIAARILWKVVELDLRSNDQCAPREFIRTPAAKTKRPFTQSV